MTGGRGYAANVQTHRRERGLTQRELATAVGVARNTVARIECGNRAPSLALLVALAHALGVQPADLLA